MLEDRFDGAIAARAGVERASACGLDARFAEPLGEAQQAEARAEAPLGVMALAQDHLDVLVAPTTGPAWTTDLVDGDHVLGGGITTPAAVAGYPHITVPMGAVHGLPVGLSFVAAAWSEGRLISYAYAYEQATHARGAPQFYPSVP